MTDLVLKVAYSNQPNLVLGADAMPPEQIASGPSLVDDGQTNLIPSAFLRIIEATAVNAESGEAFTPVRAVNANTAAGKAPGWQGSFSAANVIAGKPGFDGIYSASWNAHIAGVMRDSATNYITGTYVQSWGNAGGSINVAGLDSVKFCRAVRVQDVTGKQWKLVVPVTQSYTQQPDGFSQSRNPGNDWIESSSNTTLDCNANSFFGPGVSLFGDACPNIGDGVWLAVKPQPANTGTTTTPQVCILAYTFDQPFIHNSVVNQAVYSCSSSDVFVSTSSASAEYNARKLTVDFSMIIKDIPGVKVNDVFRQLLAQAAIKLRCDNYAHKWVTSTGLTVDFFTESMPVDAENPVEGSLVGTVTGVQTSHFSTPDATGMFKLTTPRMLAISGTGTITYARITGTSTGSVNPVMWVPVNVDYASAGVVLTRTVVNALDYAVYMKELAFRFQITA